MEDQRKKPKEERNDPTLELYEKILLKLDVKNLLRFKSVCHGWYDLISDPRFINRHLKLSRSDPEQKHHRVFSINPPITIDYKYFGFHVESKLWNKIIDKPLQCPREMRGWLEIMGSCDGLVCLLSIKFHRNSGIGNKIIIWNPSSQNLVTIPLPFSKAFTGVHWFGSDDNNSNGYKVVLSDTRKIYELSSRSSSRSNDHDGLYSWRLCDEIPLQLMCLTKAILNRGTLVNGDVHWPIIRKKHVFSYNLSTHKFRGLPAPSVFKDGSYFTLGVVDGSLGAIRHRRQNFELWIMKEYGVKKSWIRVTKLQGFEADAKIMRAIGTLRNGDLIVDVNQKTLQRYYFNGMAPRVVKTRKTNNNDSSDSITYVESLISPTKCIRLAPDLNH